MRLLKGSLAKEERRTRDLIMELNKQAGKVEDLFDENHVLRQKLGLSDADAVDIKGIKMQKEATLAQLRALNALLERQVGAAGGRGGGGGRGRRPAGQHTLPRGEGGKVRGWEGQGGSVVVGLGIEWVQKDQNGKGER